MKKIVLLILAGLAVFVMSYAQNDPFFSEQQIWKAGSRGGYVEIYNPGPDAVDLSNYRVMGAWGEDVYQTTPQWGVWLKGTLAPNDYYIIAIGGDREHVNPLNRKFGNEETHALADYITGYFDSPRDTGDRVLPIPHLGLLKIGGAADGSDTLIDRIRTEHTEDRSIIYSVAGDPEGGRKTTIRKFSITKGNPDFEDSRGTNKEDSEWIVLPMPPPSYYYDHMKLFTTIHSHMDQTESGATGLHPGIIVDKDNMTVTLPFGIRRDTVFRVFDVNPNVGWQLRWGPTLEDSASFVMRTGDSLDFYCAGNVLTMEKYHAIVSDPAPTFNKVFPKYTRMHQSEEWVAENPGVSPWYWTTRYEVTEGVNPIDSVQDVPWGTPVDTLFKYLDKAPNSTYDIIWHDGVVKTEVELGDKLEVTSQDGTKKEYWLQINEYSPSSNAFLETLIVDGDTLEDFSQGKQYYKYKVPGGTTMVPNVIAPPASQNAIVVASAPDGLKGEPEDRSTFITVTAQDDTTILVYQIEWEVSKDMPGYFEEPFITHYYPHMHAGAVGAMSIFNPNQYPLDMSEYMLVSGLGLSLNDQIRFADSTRTYRPGFKLVLTNEKRYFKIAPEVPHGDIVLPGACFNIVCDKASPLWNKPQVSYYAQNGTISDGKKIVPSQGAKDGTTTEAFALTKILNDSIFDGTKALEDAVPADYKVIDMLHAFENGTNIMLADTLQLWKGLYSEERNYQLIRKSHIQQGNPTPLASWGTDAATCEWDAYNWRANKNELKSWCISQYGNFTMNPITSHIPIVTSVVYITSDGSSNDEFILGVTDTTTVSQFLANLILSDPDQILKVANNGEKTGAEQMVNGDSLYVTSVDGENSTIYIVEVTAEGLEKDASLTSTVYTVGEATIEGVPFGITVEAIYNTVSVAATATLDLIDNRGQIVPLEWYNEDTVMVMVKTIATDSIFFRVTAQDGITVVAYQVVIDAESSDAFVTSNNYVVEETPVQSINIIPRGVDTRTFLSRLIPSPGATMKLWNKLDQERVIGNVALDDYVEVVSPDGTVTSIYRLNFFGEYVASANASLFDLTVDGTTVTGFSNETLTYQVSLEQGTTTVPTVEGLVNHDSASVTITQAQNLDGTEAERTATVVVTAEDGTQQSYMIVFDLSTGIEPALVSGPQIYSVGKKIYIKTEKVTNGDKAVVFDLTGKMIEIRFIRNYLEEIHLNTFPGVYIVNLKNNGNYYTQRVSIME